MKKTGAPEKYKLRLIAELVKAGRDGTSSLALQIALSDLGRSSLEPKPPLPASALQDPLKKLVVEGLTEKYTPPGLPHGTKTKMFYRIPKEHWPDVAVMYFPWDGESKFTDSERANFLASDVAEGLIDNEHFLKLLFRLFVKWQLMWPDGFQSEFDTFMTDQSVADPRARKLIKSGSDIIKKLRTGSPQFRKDFYARSWREATVDELLDAMGVLFNLKDGALGSEIEEMRKYARLSVSLMGYAMNDDATMGAPPILLFDLSNAFESTDKLKTKGVGPLWRVFLWRVIYVCVSHDLLRYPGTLTPHLLRKVGILSLEPLMKKVLKPYL